MNTRWIIAAVVVLALGGIGWGIASHQAGGGNFSSGASAPLNSLLEEAAGYEQNGDKLKAKDIYSKIVADYPEYDKIDEVQDNLGSLNLSIITSNTPTPQTIIHVVVPGDSLGKLAKQYNTTKELIQKSNGLKSDVIRVGQKLRIWNAPFNVFVDKSQNILMLKTGDDIVKIFHVSTGANNITPVGTFKISTKLANPVWFKPGSAPIPPESPENVLGTRWMGFDTDPHYGIHGTTEPDKIGQQVTAGCVRMRNNEVEELFDLLPAGTQVVIQN
jgi:lipoprotein-anchoring transpeptidase ErfK/SrfK